MTGSTRADLIADGHCCSCHVAPPCSFCLAPVVCTRDGCDEEAEDWIEDDDVMGWLCPAHDDAQVATQ